MAFDIAAFLFSDVLRCPWCIAQQTGNVMEDVVMLFLLPTIIIILFVYVLTTEMKILQSKFMKLLMGVAVYLFIVFGGFYEMVAELTKTYFIIIIFLLGVFYFVGGHFLKGHGHVLGGGGGATNFPMPSGSPPGGGGGGGSSGFLKKATVDDYRERMKLAQHQLDLLRRQINDYENAIKNVSPNDVTRSQLVLQLNNLKNQERDLNYNIQHRLKYST